MKRVSQRRGYGGVLFDGSASALLGQSKQPVMSAKDLQAISKTLKPNEKILMRVYSQGRSGYFALEPK